MVATPFMYFFPAGWRIYILKWKIYNSQFILRITLFEYVFHDTANPTRSLLTISIFYIILVLLKNNKF